MEETVKELKEDLKNAREMIACLNDTVKRVSKTSKEDKDEDLSGKMDRILEKLENQRNVEMKLEIIEEDLKEFGGFKEEFRASQELLRAKMESLEKTVLNIAGKVTNSKEMLKILDTVETSEGYSELFVKDFEKIHGKGEEVYEKVNEVRGIIEEQWRRNVTVAEDVEKIKVKLENLEGNQTESATNYEQLAGFITKLDSTEKSVKDCLRKIIKENENLKYDLMSGLSEDCKRNMWKAMPSLKTLGDLRKVREVKCKNQACQFTFPKDTRLREDGVSIKCPRCKCFNIVDKLKEGQKWMLSYGCFHYQSVEHYTTDTDYWECQVCEELCLLYDTRVGQGPHWKCDNCQSYLSKDIPIREDGVTIECQECRWFKIVGKLMTNYKWMHISNCNHFMQYPANTVEGERENCKICGEIAQLDRAMKCFSCLILFTKNLPLREDGVSVSCPNCNMPNIVGKLNTQHTWRRAIDCDHFSQIPYAKLNPRIEEKENCATCGIETTLLAENTCAVKLC